MKQPDNRAILNACGESLRDVHSIQDFVVAVAAGAQIAAGMLDDVEKRLLGALRVVNEDGAP